MHGQVYQTLTHRVPKMLALPRKLVIKKRHKMIALLFWSIICVYFHSDSVGRRLDFDDFVW